jgi:hypothetical protein
MQQLPASICSTDFALNASSMKKTIVHINRSSAYFAGNLPCDDLPLLPNKSTPDTRISRTSKIRRQAEIQCDVWEDED